MLFSTVGQGALFIWMMLCGVVIGAWYGVTALLRRVLQAGFLLSLACDLLFGLGGTAILLGFMIMGNYGQVRLFSILGAALGFGLFMFALANPAKRLLDALEGRFRQIMSWLTKKRLINIIFR